MRFLACGFVVLLFFSPFPLDAQIDNVGRQPSGALESPAHGSVVSGIGVISGWICPYEGETVTVHINHGGDIPVAMGQPRDDTRLICGTVNNGFVTQVNWNLLPEGTYVIRAAIDGGEFAQSVFTVGTTGQEFLTGLEFAVDVPNFPVAGETSRFVWNESTQHLELLTVAPVRLPHRGELYQGEPVEGDPFVPREGESEGTPNSWVGTDTPPPPAWEALVGYWYLDSDHRPGRTEWRIDKTYPINHLDVFLGWSVHGSHLLYDYTYNAIVYPGSLEIFASGVARHEIRKWYASPLDITRLNGYPYLSSWAAHEECFVYAFDYVDDTREEIAGMFWRHPQGATHDVWKCWHVVAERPGDLVSGYKQGSAALAQEWDRIVEATRPREKEPEEEEPEDEEVCMDSMDPDEGVICVDLGETGEG